MIDFYVILIASIFYSVAIPSIIIWDMRARKRLNKEYRELIKILREERSEDESKKD